MLVGAQLPLPEGVAACIGAGRPETGATAEKAAVAQDENAKDTPTADRVE